MDIHVLHRQGHSIRAIGRQMGIARNTVRSYLRDRARTPSYGPRAGRASKLDPFKSYLQERIEAAKPDWIPATVLHREIAAQGFDGKEGSHDFAARIDAAHSRLAHADAPQYRYPAERVLL